MASIKDVATSLIGFNQNTTSSLKPEKTPETNFSDVLTKLKTDTEKTTSTTKKLSDNVKAESAVKKALWELVSTGTENAKETLDELSSDDKAEAMRILQMIIDSISGEISGAKASGSTQELINSLFSSSDEKENETDLLSAQKALDELQLSISKLKDESTTSSDVLSQLVPMLVSLGNVATSNTSTVDNSVTAVSGEVSVKNGDTTYHFSLADFQKKIQEFEDVLNGKVIQAPVVPIIPVKPTTPTTPTGTTTPTDTTPTTPTGTTTPTDTTPKTPTTGTTTPTDTTTTTPTTGTTTPTDTTPTTGTTTPTDTTTPTTPTDPAAQQTSDTVTPVQTARAYTYQTITAENAGVSSKVLAESNLARASALSQRVIQKSSELDSLDLTGIAGLNTQNVLQTPFQSIADNLSQVPVEAQILSNISEQLANSKVNTTSEMTMTLNPDNLGEISVRLVNEAGKISVTIAAQSEITQKLLQDKLPTLMSSLQNVNGEVKEVKIVEANQNASYAGFNLGSQNAGQSNYGSNSGSTQARSSYATSPVENTQEISPDTSTQTYLGGSKLWQTA